MAFKQKVAAITSNHYFHLAYFFTFCAVILIGALRNEVAICAIASLFLITPLFFFFYDIFTHIVCPKYEEPLLPPVMPPGVKPAAKSPDDLDN